ncbi:MAG: transposase [Actinomycetia bacterium]|nr:transposase [Actinomycetes bacterium]
MAAVTLLAALRIHVGAVLVAVFLAIEVLVIFVLSIARLIEFDLAVTDERGKQRTSRLRVLTTLLDPATHPALQIAQVYAERWQIELAYLRIKVTLRGSGAVLRGQTPALARQEIWGFLTVYNALCDLATAAAALDGIDPDQISFIATLRMTRTRVSADVCCAHCRKRPSDSDDPVAGLIGDIGAHPRNRTGRNRSSPRTAKQRRSEPSTTVTCSFEIVTSNLPKET